MWKRAYNIILIAAIGGALLVRLGLIVHRAAQRPVEYRATSDSRDVGAALRQIAGSSPQSSKPWVLDEVQFRNAHADRPWIIGRSERPALSDSEAVELAHADAAGQLVPLIRLRVNPWPGDGRWLAGQIDAAIRAGRLDTDRCVERFDRPYAPVYAGSVLIDASAGKVEPIVREIRAGLAVRHQSLGIRLALAGMVLIVTWLAYALSNSVTRGYVTTRLRSIAAAVTIGVLLLA